MARYRTWAEWDGLTGADALSDAERQLAEACKAGVPCILGDGTRPAGPSVERTIRAEFLRYLILGGIPPAVFYRRAVNETQPDQQALKVA